MGIGGPCVCVCSVCPQHIICLGGNMLYNGQRATIMSQAILRVLEETDTQVLWTFSQEGEYDELTNQGDKKRAFEGILRRYRGNMDGKAISFLFGLPVFAFDQKFCWRSPRIQLRRRE